MLQENLVKNQKIVAAGYVLMTAVVINFVRHLGVVNLLERSVVTIINVVISPLMDRGCVNRFPIQTE